MPIERFSTTSPTLAKARLSIAGLTASQYHPVNRFLLKGKMRVSKGYCSIDAIFAVSLHQLDVSSGSNGNITTFMADSEDNRVS